MGSAYLTVEIDQPKRGYPTNPEERVEAIAATLEKLGWERMDDDQYGRPRLSKDWHSIYPGVTRVTIKSEADKYRWTRIWFTEYENPFGKAVVRDVLDRIEVFVYRLD